MPRGTKLCEWCGEKIILRITRDLTRKRFCSRRCCSAWMYHKGGLGKRLRYDGTGIRKPFMWIKNPHPMRGKTHSNATKARISKMQKERYIKHPERFATGERHGFWNGGKTHNRCGYVLALKPNGKYALEHRLVMERLLGRQLLKTEQIHHKDGDRTNNHPSNLEVMDQHEHRTMHMKRRWQEVKSNPKRNSCT